jgi:hypothetical protein
MAAVLMLRENSLRRADRRTLIFNRVNANIEFSSKEELVYGTRLESFLIAVTYNSMCSNSFPKDNSHSVSGTFPTKNSCSSTHHHFSCMCVTYYIHTVHQQWTSMHVALPKSKYTCFSARTRNYVGLISVVYVER